MAREGTILFSILIPTKGNRPKALQHCVNSVVKAAQFAGLGSAEVEILIAFNGAHGRAPKSDFPVHTFNLPKADGHHAARSMLAGIATGEKLLFPNDDSTLKPWALASYLRHFDAEVIIGRTDTQLTFETPFLPRSDDGPMVREGNIDLLNVCASRRLVMDRCGGFACGEPCASFRTIARWVDHAHSVTTIEETVGIVDAGRSLDVRALSHRQAALLDRLAGQRDIPPQAVLAQAARLTASS